MKTRKIRLDINFLKIVIGVIFSLIWGRVMYMIWPQPSFLIFVLFYLIAGSVIIKWGFFEIVDRIFMRIRLKAVSREISESDIRVHRVFEGGPAREQAGVNAADLGSPRGSHRNLVPLEQAVVDFGRQVKEAMARAVLSLQKKDVTLAAEVIEHDSEIDHLRYVLERDCMRYIRSNCGSDSDLRKLVAMLGIVTELERMGDYAEGIAKITLMIGSEMHIQPPAELKDMAERALVMLEGSLEALKNNNMEEAKRVSRQDEKVDKLYDQAFHQLVMFMIEHPGEITRVTRLVWVAHNLERFADRVTNICERVVFSVNGELKEVSVSRY